MDPEASSNRFSFFLAMLQCKQRNGTSDASRTLNNLSMIASGFQSQAMRLEERRARDQAMLAIATFNMHDPLGFLGLPLSPKIRPLPGQKECRRSLQFDLACDLLGGFSRYVCQFGIAWPVRHGLFYLRQNLRRVHYPMLFAQCLKFG